MKLHEIPTRPPFLLDGIHLSNQGGLQQYDSKRDKFLKSYLDKLEKKQDNPKTSLRMRTESLGLQSSVNTMSIQVNQKLGVRHTQPHQYKSSPDYMRQHNETPKKKRNTEVSLPKLETSVAKNNQKPITQEQLLLFLDQIRQAVDNVQQIVCQPDHQVIQQSQPIRSSKKFKISQEQQTDSSYIRQLLKNTQANKLNKKTQTKNLRGSSQQGRYILKTEQNEESDVTEKKGSRFPHISQSAQKSRVQVNRVQSQILQNQEYIEETNKLISSNETQQFSSNSNETSENVRKRTTSKQDSTQKKYQKNLVHLQEMIETNKNVIKIIDKNQQTQQNSIKQLSSQGYSEEFEEAEQIDISDYPIAKPPSQQVVMEERSNLTTTPIQNKRPIHLKIPNPDVESQQQKSNLNDEDYEYSNEFLSEQQKKSPQLKKSLKQSGSSKVGLEINPQPEYSPVTHNQAAQKKSDLLEVKEDKKTLLQSVHTPNNTQEEAVSVQNKVQQSQEIKNESNHLNIKNGCQNTPQQQEQQEPAPDTLLQSSLTVQSLYVSKSQIPYRDEHKKDQQSQQSSKTVSDKNIQILEENQVQQGSITQIIKNQEPNLNNEEILQIDDQKSEIQIQKEKTLNNQDQEQSQIVQDNVQDVEHLSSNQDISLKPLSYKSQQLFYMQEQQNEQIQRSQIIGNKFTQDQNFLEFLGQKKEEIKQQKINNPQQLQNSNISSKKLQESQQQQQISQSEVKVIDDQKLQSQRNQQLQLQFEEPQNNIINQPINNIDNKEILQAKKEDCIQISKNEDLGRSEIIENNSQHKSLMQKQKDSSANLEDQNLQNGIVQDKQNVEQPTLNEERSLKPLSYKSQQLYNLQMEYNEKIQKSQIIGNQFNQDPKFLEFLGQKKQEMQKQQINNLQQLKNSNVSSKKLKESQQNQQISPEPKEIDQSQEKNNNSQPLQVQTEVPDKVIVSNNISQQINTPIQPEILEVVQKNNQIDQSQKQQDVNEESENLKQK